MAFSVLQNGLRIFSVKFNPQLIFQVFQGYICFTFE